MVVHACSPLRCVTGYGLRFDSEIRFERKKNDSHSKIVPELSKIMVTHLKRLLLMRTAVTYSLAVAIVVCIYFLHICDVLCTGVFQYICLPLRILVNVALYFIASLVDLNNFLPSKTQ